MPTNASWTKSKKKPKRKPQMFVYLIISSANPAAIFDVVHASSDAEAIELAKIALERSEPEYSTNIEYTLTKQVAQLRLVKEVKAFALGED
jgi:hypothetical protein